MEFLPPLAIDPVQPANPHLGTYLVYPTTNNAGNWTAISGDLTGNGGQVTTIAVAPTDSNTVYAGTSDGRIAVTTNALAGVGAVWKNPYIEGAGQRPRYMTQVSVDPHISTTAYL